MFHFWWTLQLNIHSKTFLLGTSKCAAGSTTTHRTHATGPMGAGETMAADENMIGPETPQPFSIDRTRLVELGHLESRRLGRFG